MDLTSVRSSRNKQLCIAFRWNVETEKIGSHQPGDDVRRHSVHDRVIRKVREGVHNGGQLPIQNREYLGSLG